MDSFRDVPFIVDHEMLSGFEDDDEAEAPEDKGIDGVLTSNVYYQAPWMLGDLKIFSRKAQRALAKNKKDLSLGYSCDFEMKPGVFDGQPYEVVQFNLRGNHIALVDEGRVPGARVLDGRSMVFDHLNFDVRPSDEDQQMKKGKRSKAADNAVEQLQALIPALQQFLNEEAGEPEHQDEGQGGEGAVPLNADHEGGEAGGGAGGAAAGGAAGGGEMGGGEAGGSDITQLISQVQTILSQIAASVGGTGEGTDEGEATDEGKTVEGLADNEHGEGRDEGEEPESEGAEDEAEEANGSASKGPAAGRTAMAGDSAVRRFYADSALKSRLYDRISSVVGAFNHKSMDAHQVASYGLKKLQAAGHLKGIKAGDSKSLIPALNAYFDGVEMANKKHRAGLQGQRRINAGDSAVGGVSAELDAYLAGGK
jgi:hypothetical protein